MPGAPAAAKYPMHFTRFAARYVPMVAKWAMTPQEYAYGFTYQRGDTMGLQVEPCADGGVFLTATNGSRIAQIHDPLGVCGEPVIVSLPEPFVDACRPPTGPRVVPPEDGVEYPLALPEWMQPDQVTIHWNDAPAHERFYMVMVSGKPVPKDQQRAALGYENGPHTSAMFYRSCSNYHSFRDAVPFAPTGFRPLVRWQHPLTLPHDPKPITTIAVNTEFLADLQYLGHLAELVFDEATRAIHARFRDAPNIKAAIMPLMPRSQEERERDIQAWEARVRDEQLARMPMKVEGPQ